MLTPRPYQEAGRTFLALTQHALLGDEMRVGKTPQAILAADAIEAKRILVACPAIATEHWRREFQKWSPSRPSVVVLGEHDVPPACFEGTVVTSYDRLLRSRDALRAQWWDVAIVDEAHFAKNPKALRTLAVYGKDGIGWQADRMWALSGTPAPKHAGELWPLLRAYGVVKCTYEEFVATYCYSNADGHILGTRASRVHEVRTMLAPIMLRRTRKEVAPDMPDIGYELMFVQPSKQALGVLEAEGWSDAELLAWVEANAESLPEIRTAVATAKAVPLAEEITEALREKVLTQTVVFGYHIPPLMALATELRNAGFRVGVITGKTSQRERVDIQDSFKAELIDVVVGNVLACGTAIDLSTARHGYFLELDWVPGNNVQAASRLMNMEKKDPVTFDVVTWAGSFDERVQRVLTRRVAELKQLY